MARSIQPRPVPPKALLARYADAAQSGYADAYSTDVPWPVSLQQLIEAFYSSPAIALELALLRLLFRRPASRSLAAALAHGDVEDFSAWRVEDRTLDEVLMYEALSGKTRSWLKVEPLPDAATRLWFGSAVLPAGHATDGAPRMSVLFHALLGFHRLYSRMLLAGVRARLDRR